MKTLISVAFYHSPSSVLNMLYFLHHAIIPCHDYVIAVNGESSIPFPTHLPNVTILRRPNVGFDFGAHEAIVSHLGPDGLGRYDFFIFMNASVIGPMITDDDDDDVDWVDIFRQRFFRHEIGLLGTTIVCLPPTDAGGYGPRVEGFFWCTDPDGLRMIRDEKTILAQHPTKYSAIVNGEYGLSRCILRHGRNLGCMLRRYDGIDWRDPREWHHNHFQHPSRCQSFYGSSIDPYEVVFHKWFWHGEHPVNYDVVERHIIRKNRTRFGDIGLSSSYRQSVAKEMSDVDLETHFFLYDVYAYL
jgi:hypothetical protein